MKMKHQHKTMKKKIGQDKKKQTKNTENRKIVEKKSHQGNQLTKVSEKHFHAFVHWKRIVFCSFTCTVWVVFF